MMLAFSTGFFFFFNEGTEKLGDSVNILRGRAEHKASMF